MAFRFNKSGFSNPSQLVIALLVVVIAVFGLFWLARSIFRILAFLAPFMLIAAAIMDYRVIFDYVRTIIGWLKSNTLFGIAAIVLSILGFPFVSLFLLMRAYASRFGKGRGLKDVIKGDYIKFEEVEEEDLELPEFKKEKLKR
jgi:hypothetical protein